ncbi:BnaA09g45390D [Brassica napus]|uniref:(rape) hypothetical protein n=1 Tax=Brassica napus TaxID=3708 RepID=A0A078HA46_BRANA|nr:unnamed protein product [Brassica napus]CDY33733.1 BnaA09g45390D [Brassica napus]
MSLALSRYTGKYTYHQLETRHPQFPIFVNDANFRYTKLLTFISTRGSIPCLLVSRIGQAARFPLCGP